MRRSLVGATAALLLGVVALLGASSFTAPGAVAAYRYDPAATPAAQSYLADAATSAELGEHASSQRMAAPRHRYDDPSHLARASARLDGYRLAPNTATRLTNGTQFETLSSQPISGVTRSAHRTAANKQLFSQLDADPALRQFYDDALGTDVMAHMQSGRSGLRNPPGTQWHHPTWDSDSLLVLRNEVHRHPMLQGILHPGARGGDGWAEFYDGGM